MGEHNPKKARLHFIDFTRGIVMILMAWDHVSGFYNPGKMGGEGLQGNFPNYTDLLQFLLRFMTHVCAPTFMFLAGTSLAISVHKRQQRGEKEGDISKRIIARGTMLLLLAAFVVGPSFGSGPLYIGVISCFGFCFIIFSIYRRLPPKVILVFSLIIVLFHQYLALEWLPDGMWWDALRIIIHEPTYRTRFNPFSGLYPIIPWIGVMGLGWSFGDFLTKFNWEETQKLKIPILVYGLCSIVAFFIIRWINGFGNLVSRPGDSLIAWLSVSKYPPSIAFLLWTLGLMCLIMSFGIWLEKVLPDIQKGATSIILLYGQTALFFYIVHLPLYRLHPLWWNERLFILNLTSTSIFWVIGLGILWWLGTYYLRFKRSHPDSIVQYI